jgi:hypothetical protein
VIGEHIGPHNQQLRGAPGAVGKAVSVGTIFEAQITGTRPPGWDGSASLRV